MRKEIADQWVAALRSGQYNQGFHRLRDDAAGFCCLGVLCDLHAKEHDEVWRLTQGGHLERHKYAYLGEFETPPQAAMEWAKLHSNVGRLPSDAGRFATSSLAELNDRRTNFEEIAKLIEQYWEKL